MPDREFLEKYPLYRKFRVEALPATIDALSEPPVHMFCETCKSEQTFVMENNYREASNGLFKAPTLGMVARVVYVCGMCGEFYRYFMLRFDRDSKGEFIQKVGQDPPWEITPDRVMQKELGQYADYYKKGLTCESQSYGVGAFAYYRRIVEEIIDKLLAQIPDLMTGTERTQYEDALKKVKDMTVAEDKIKLVKDLLPPILRPQGTNPLSTLYDALSEGLHSQTDERCIELAAQIHAVLVFLVTQIAATQTAGASFSEGMKRLLERKKT